MPQWYVKYYEKLQKCKEISRATSIWLWHEETLARMRARLMNLKREVTVGKTNNF